MRRGFQGFRNVPPPTPVWVRTMAIISMEYSPKRKKRLLTTFLDLCRTQWVERHAAQEVFLALFLSILRVLEAMSNERLFENQFGETAWNWDTDSKSKANGLLHALHKVEFIITLLTTMKCSSILKPLSIKLQKREINVFQAYNLIYWIYQRRHREISTRQQEKQTLRLLCRGLLVSNSVKAVSKQKHRRITTKDRSQFLYNGQSYFWDCTHPDPNNDAVMSSLLCILPALLLS